MVLVGPKKLQIVLRRGKISERKTCKVKAKSEKGPGSPNETKGRLKAEGKNRRSKGWEDRPGFE